jgi:DNA-binding NarL/FixJ family response regulator
VILHANLLSLEDVYGGSTRAGAQTVCISHPIRHDRDAARVPTVLIVDDDAKYRRALTAFLDASFDLDVIADTGSTEEAVALAGHLRPDAAVVDIAMPVVDGVELAERLRAVLPELAIVLVTGNVRAINPERIHALGNATLVAKGDPLPVENALRTLSRRPS